jgi:YVTN family beta-propeller protein
LDLRPSGTVTFLFTDVEGSTRLLGELRDRYGGVLAEHQRLLREAFAAHGGEEVDTQGDGFFFVFTRARDAAAAAADGQRALAAYDWPDRAAFRVRMGLHTGEPALSDEGRYHGMGVHRTARIMAAGHGGQILASQATASVLADDDLDGVSLRDRGEYKLKDFERPERIYELELDGVSGKFPPLKTEGESSKPFYQRPLVIGSVAGVVAAAVAIPMLAFGGGSSQASLSRMSANSVGIIDPSSGAIVDEVADIPSPTRVASGEGAIWVTSSQANSVYRIDALSRELRQTIRVGDGPTGIAVGRGDVWVANTLAGTVSRIDTDSNEPVGEPIHVGNGPTAVAFGEGSVWVTNVDDQTVSRIDPVTGRVKATLPVAAAGRGIAVGSGSVWISDSIANRVVRLDPKTDDVTQTIGVGSGPSAVAVGAGAVWVANTLDGTVSRIDPGSNQVRATVPVGASPVAIAAGKDAVWVANEAAQTVVRFDPGRGDEAEVIRTGSTPTGLALDTSLWVAAQAARGAHRGGTLRVDMAFVGEERDPAVAYDSGTWNILNLTNDGLVGFKNVGGGEGAQVVPNLATSMPTPTDGGRTYAFRLRPKIRYSTGARMKASDVQASFERLFKAGIPVDYFTRIRGGSACLERPKACDLSDGIVTDDEAGTVTFHLTAADGEFLYKLATPFGSVLPAGTPVSKGGRRPVPATGPYKIASQSGGRVQLVRNEQFRVWDPIARPAGYPDEIVVTLRPTDRAAADVARGRADVATMLPFASTPRVAGFATQHPAQVHTTPAPTTFFWYLNAQKPPFDDVRARRAVNYALDREEFVRSRGGREAAQPTCQILPPNFPGYRPYCPYTANPGGTWSGPDLPKARALVKASGTAGKRVEFWGPEVPDAGAFERLVRRTFTQLGYRVSFRRFPIEKYWEALGRVGPGTAPEAGANGWSADYPSPATFLGPLTCRAIADGANLSRFCSPAYDRAFAHAQSVQAREPNAATKLWADLDRMATDSAAWVPTNNPRNIDLVSKRVGNFQHHPLFGVLLDQLWVK